MTSYLSVEAITVSVVAFQLSIFIYTILILLRAIFSK